MLQLSQSQNAVSRIAMEECPRPAVPGVYSRSILLCDTHSLHQHLAALVKEWQYFRCLTLYTMWVSRLGPNNGIIWKYQCSKNLLPRTPDLFAKRIFELLRPLSRPHYYDYIFGQAERFSRCSRNIPICSSELQNAASFIFYFIRYAWLPHRRVHRS